MFQVDDSPRYEALGEWEHYGSYSAWTSDRTARPLPRRETTVRSDYQILEGINRHTLTPTGWVQEEENLKLVLDEQGQPATRHAVSRARARRRALRAHRRLRFLGRRPLLAAQRRVLARRARRVGGRIRRARHFEYLEEVDGQEMFVPLFEYADRLDGGEPYDAATAADIIRAPSPASCADEPRHAAA